ncbi:uncharacterized protein DSM5745_05513 [Aspergillus mulundensis]|uniref:Uncharacterized protein n=1 Tax=Aspergillus mulundensis TaxID=1810919 RepID=A0A3D8RXV7_9EURO|nr:Uncharacterized protein DSM5745_05513 [Aspergillus mulundensis]RDW78661.1 Uncharacterized protein DSM5745_05513 [Aspergillus mulundensis]
MDCFRQIYRLVKSPFTRNKHRVMEIGPPTDFRKEELPSFFTDDDAITLHSRTALEKDAIVKAIEEEPSKRDRIKTQVRRLSVKMARPQPLIDMD